MVVEIEETTGSWSGEKYYEAKCGCGWPGYSSRTPVRGSAIIRAVRHNRETRHHLGDSVRRLAEEEKAGVP